MNPPQTFEILIDGLIGNADAKQELLGDLAEEWGRRSMSGGVRVANRWYRWQVVAAVPFLLRAWLRETGSVGVIGTLLVALVLRMTVWVCGFVSMLIVVTLVQFLGGGRAVTSGLWMNGNALWAFVSGIVFAQLYRRATLASASCLILAFVVLKAVVSDPIDNEQLYRWYPQADKLVGAAFATLGVFVVMLQRYRTMSPVR